MLPDEFRGEECGHILEYFVVVLFAIAKNAFAFFEIYQRLTVTVSVQCLNCVGFGSSLIFFFKFGQVLEIAEERLIKATKPDTLVEKLFELPVFAPKKLG